MNIGISYDMEAIPFELNDTSPDTVRGSFKMSPLTLFVSEYSPELALLTAIRKIIDINFLMFSYFKFRPNPSE